MAARAAITQRPQYGVETTLGTAVDADKALRTVTLSVETDIKREMVKPGGRKFPTSVYTATEASKGSLEGQMCPRELVDILSLVFGDAYTTGVVVSDEAWSREFKASDAVNSWTVQVGDAENSVEVPGVVATDVEFAFQKNSGKAEIKVTLVGQVFDNEGTLTTGATEQINAILTGAGVSVYSATSLAGLDSDPTQVTKSIAETIKLSGIRDVAWYTNADHPSWSDTVETDMSDSEFELTLEADSVGRAQLTQLRAGTNKYYRIVVTGRLIDGSTYHTLTIDLCVTPDNYSEGEEDAVYAVTVPLRIVEDEDGFSHSVSLVTDVSLLTALTPTTGSVTPTADGFTFNITNYDDDYTWTATAPGATVVIGTPSGATALVTVSGLGAGVTKTVTIGTTRTLYLPGTATKEGTSTP